MAAPETNGVVDRFIRTLKEQAIYGRTFRTAAEVWAAVAAFVANYNVAWLVEKNGFRSPIRARSAWTTGPAGGRVNTTRVSGEPAASGRKPVAMYYRIRDGTIEGWHAAGAL